MKYSTLDRPHFVPEGEKYGYKGKSKIAHTKLILALHHPDIFAKEY